MAVGEEILDENGEVAGVITFERDLESPGLRVPVAEPPPPDHPSAINILVPPSAAELGLVTARSMDDAVRKAR